MQSNSAAKAYVGTRFIASNVARECYRIIALKRLLTALSGTFRTRPDRNPIQEWIEKYVAGFAYNMTASVRLIRLRRVEIDDERGSKAVHLEREPQSPNVRPISS